MERTVPERTTGSYTSPSKSRRTSDNLPSPPSHNPRADPDSDDSDRSYFSLPTLLDQYNRIVHDWEQLIRAMGMFLADAKDHSTKDEIFPALKNGRRFLDNTLSMFISWGCGIRVDSGTLEMIQDSTITHSLQAAFEDIDFCLAQMLHEKWSTVRDCRLALGRLSPELQKDLVNVIFCLQDQIKPIRMYMAVEMKSGPLNALAAQVERLANDPKSIVDARTSMKHRSYVETPRGPNAAPGDRPQLQVRSGSKNQIRAESEYRGAHSWEVLERESFPEPRLDSYSLDNHSKDNTSNSSKIPLGDQTAPYSRRNSRPSQHQAPRSTTITILEKLQKDYCPPFDNATVIAIASDYDLTNRDELNQVRALFEDLKEGVADEEKSGFGQLDSGGLAHNRDLDVENSSSIYTASYQDIEATSTTTALSSIDLQSSGPSDFEELQANANLSSLENLGLQGKETMLKDMFPSLSIYTITRSLEKCNGNVSSAMDILLNRIYLENDSEQENLSELAPKEADGFVGYSATRGRGGMKRKNTRIADERQLSLASSKAFMDAAAAYYSERGTQPSKNLSAAAADALVDEQSSDTSLDVHNVSVYDAVRITRTRVTQWWEGLGDSESYPGAGDRARRGLDIVTGRGTPSKPGAPRIGPALLKQLTAEGWKVLVGNGRLTVIGKRRME